MRELCCFCGSKIKGFGNNAMPLKDAKCCDECDNTIVLNFRLYLCGERNRGILLHCDDRVQFIAPNSNNIAFTKSEIKSYMDAEDDIVEKIALKGWDDLFDIFAVKNAQHVYGVADFNLTAFRLFDLFRLKNIMIIPKEISVDGSEF